MMNIIGVVYTVLVEVVSLPQVQYDYSSFQ